MTSKRDPYFGYVKKILPRGTLTKTRRKYFALGAVSTLLMLGAAAALAYFAMPVELRYKPAATTLHPTPGPVSARGLDVLIPPCTGAGKDCMDVWRDPAVRYVPAPGTLVLVVSGIVGILIHKGMV